MICPGLPDNAHTAGDTHYSPLPPRQDADTTLLHPPSHSLPLQPSWL